MKVSILGTEYEIKKVDFSLEPFFEKNSFCAYCDPNTKKIVICKRETYPGWEDATEESIKNAEKQTLRHEIVHAFLNESGLWENSFISEGPWAKNEEMVDWMALQGPKIYETWKKAGVV